MSRDIGFFRDPLRMQAGGDGPGVIAGAAAFQVVRVIQPDQKCDYFTHQIQLMTKIYKFLLIVALYIPEHIESKLNAEIPFYPGNFGVKYTSN